MTDNPKPAKPLSRRLFRWTLELVALAALLTIAHLWQTRDVIKGVAPELTGQRLNGELFELARQRDAPILIHFWATWCPVCGLEADNINGLVGDYPLITIAMNSGSHAEIHKYLREQDLTFPVISDPDGVLSAVWGVRAVPTTFILDKDGNIRFVTVGYTSSLGLRARLWLADDS
ncbi:MAG: protein disulfide oxidoreductase [Pseudomonadota bacterium]